MLDGQIQVYQDQIKNLNVDKQQAASAYKDLDHVRVKIEDDLIRLQQEHQSCAKRFEEYESKVNDIGSICLADNQKAAECIQIIQNKYPNVIGLVLDEDRKAVDAVITDNQKMVIASISIPISSKLVSSAVETPIQISSQETQDQMGF